MLGLIAAVWAVVPETARLSFRLSLCWFDWIVIWMAVVALHVFYFEPVFRVWGVYPVLGDWRWGFDKGGTQYLLFLILAIFIYVRSKATWLTRRNLPLFERLATSWLYLRKFEELATLLDHHLKTVLAFANATHAQGRVARWIRPREVWPGVRIGQDGTFRLDETASASPGRRALNRFRTFVANAVRPAEASQEQALQISKAMLSSRELVGFLALAKPRLCLGVMESAAPLVEDFQDHFFEALLANENSILYSELKNSENFAGGQQGHRLSLPTENHLLRFYLADVKVAGRLGVFRSVGEAVLSRIDSDDDLMRRLNGPLLRYNDVGKFRCPVFTGIGFFRIMVLEGLHQRSNDHLWLHYLPHFCRRLVARARAIQPDDANHEFATPLAYVLYQLVDTMTAWIDDAERLTTHGDELGPEVLEGRHVYISFEAAEALPGVLEPILRSDRVPSRLKEELLTVALNTVERLDRHPQLEPLAAFLIESMVRPYRMAPNEAYLRELRSSYSAQDHVLRARMQRFERALGGAKPANY